ncbi:hypothetical protein HanIR_Chr04g0201341 [Helianthus annuus]|nr:hypothetical protein HanIR_Chr04g0201341 [Helianthus annuus]
MSPACVCGLTLPALEASGSIEEESINELFTSVRQKVMRRRLTHQSEKGSSCVRLGDWQTHPHVAWQTPPNGSEDSSQQLGWVLMYPMAWLPLRMRRWTIWMRQWTLLMRPWTLRMRQFTLRMRL